LYSGREETDDFSVEDTFLMIRATVFIVESVVDTSTEVESVVETSTEVESVVETSTEVFDVVFCCDGLRLGMIPLSGSTC
jgi:hypothetical protein